MSAPVDNALQTVPTAKSVRMSAIRKLYEIWGAPLDLLQQAWCLKGRRVFEDAVEQSWQRAVGTGALLMKLSRSLEGQLDRFDAESAQMQVDEKSARALAAFAKTIESLADLEAKFRQETESRVAQDRHAAASQRETSEGLAETRSQELDRRLAQLVAKFGNQRDVEGEP
ncbi:MAG: hypothetical protein AAGI12_10055 [Pseudomonadota bacterium]